MRSSKTDTQSLNLTGETALNTMDLVCFSHLPWNYVFQRPQHLLKRGAQNRRIFYVEEPNVDAEPTRLVTRMENKNLMVVTPHLRKELDKFEGAAAHRALIDQLFRENQIRDYVLWYYTPLAVAYTNHLNPQVVVYDCMDELSAFNGANPKMKEYEEMLLQRADLVFTGGQSLYESKRDQNPNVHLFPSSIDMAHFSQARLLQLDPEDQAEIPHPRLGYFGVIDERMDLTLIDGIAAARPDWHLVLIGPFAKVDLKRLPRRPNIHYLGKKDYSMLPAYLSGWDVAILPFAQNRSTQFISPTKTPEYLAGGKPVVSTPIRDVMRTYGDSGLVEIANGVDDFVAAVERNLNRANRDGWLSQVDEQLSRSSWDLTWTEMSQLIEAAAQKRLEGFNVGLSTGTSVPATGLSKRTGESNETCTRPLALNQSKVYDYLIVGAGFAGSVLAERLARGSGKKVLLIDCRPHIAGNAYDYYNDEGILVHKYGPHIFHTNSKEVFAYLSRFTEWRPYEHRVRASVDGRLLPLPINLDTINELYGMHLTSMEVEKFFHSIAEPIEQVHTSEDVVVSKVGRQLYEKFFRNYTRKQWDLDPSELDASVTSRVPIRHNRDDRYFTDIYQSMPAHGYTRMFENMLDHPNIQVMLNTDYRDLEGYVSYNELIYTGPIDEYFGYCYGKLPYRSLQFRFETLDEVRHQPVAVVNYPNEHAYTRATEFKHLTGQEHDKTTLVYEYPCSEGDPYYPIPRAENAELYQKYKRLADAASGVYFAGRLATYKYYNMDQVTAQALTLYAKIAGLSREESITAFAGGKYITEMPCSLLASEETE